MLYHASPTAGLRVLQPRPSAHGRAYVYAIRGRAAALAFGAPWDDFDFLMDEEQGVPSLYECYPGALAARYQRRGCSLYTLPETGFLQGVTGWAPEWVCPEPVPVAEEQAVPDLYAALLAEQAAGRLALYPYSESPERKAMVARHLVDRLVRSDYWRRADADPRFQTHFAPLLAALQALMNGDCL